MLPAGGQPLPIINLPADLYEHFSRRLDYEDILKTGISPRSIFTGSRDKSDNSNEDSSDNSERESPLPAPKLESLNTEDATGTMQAEVLTKLEDQIKSLQQELISQQEKVQLSFHFH